MKSFVLLGFAVLQAINGEIQIYNDVNKISFKSTDSFSLKCNYTVNDNIKILLGTNDVASCTTTFGTCSASDSRFTAAATISTTLPTPPNEFVVTATAGFSTALCGTYTCQGSTGSPSDTVDISWNKFSTANTSLTPLELSAGESGALNITTDCLFPASDQSITINWYKTYQDGQADEALDSTKDSNIEIYNETQRSTCTDTCGSEEDAKLVIGCRYTPPSNPGKGFQLRAEVIHKDYIDKLYWTFTGTYYVEGPPTTTTTTTTTPTTTTTTPSTTTTTTMPTTTTTLPSTTTITTMPTTTTTSPSTTTTTTTPTTTSIETTTISTTTTLTSKHAELSSTNGGIGELSTTKPSSVLSSTSSPKASNERTVIIVVASTVGGVVLVGLVVFLAGLFLYRARRPGHGHGKHNRNHKRNTRQHGIYYHSGPNNSHDMEMHPRTASYMDTRHGYPHSSKGYPDRPLGVSVSKQRHEGSQLRNTNYVNSKYSVYPGSADTPNFSPQHYHRYGERQRPATTGNIHPSYVYPTHQFGYPHNRTGDYSDNWNMY